MQQHRMAGLTGVQCRAATELNKSHYSNSYHIQIHYEHSHNSGYAAAGSGGPGQSSLSIGTKPPSDFLA